MHSAKLAHLAAVLLFGTLCSAAFVPFANGVIAEKPDSFAPVPTAHIFQNHVVYVNARRRELICAGDVCRYCTHSASPVAPVYGSCYSPTRSAAIDREYAGGRLGWSAMHSFSFPGNTNDRLVSSQMHSAAYPVHSAASPSDPNGAFTSSPSHSVASPGHVNIYPSAAERYTTNRGRVFESSSYIFKHNVVYVSAQRCELVCQSTVCQFCPRTSSHENYGDVSRECFSPRRSMSIDKEYASKLSAGSVVHPNRRFASPSGHWSTSPTNTNSFSCSPSAHAVAARTYANDFSSSPPHAFKHKAVYFDFRLCDLFCEQRVCRYCPRTYAHRSGSDYSGCYSPSRSASIEKEYATGAVYDSHSGAGRAGTHGHGGGARGNAVGTYGHGVGTGGTGDGFYRPVAGSQGLAAGSYGHQADFRGHGSGIGGYGVGSVGLVAGSLGHGIGFDGHIDGSQAISTGSYGHQADFHGTGVVGDGYDVGHVELAAGSQGHDVGFDGRKSFAHEHGVGPQAGDIARGPVVVVNMDLDDGGSRRYA